MWKVPALARAMRQAVARRVHEVRLFPGVTGLLCELRRHGIRTAIVSSNSQVNVEAVLGSKYASMIDHFGCGATIFGKARRYGVALRRLGIARERTLCVGDEIRDAEAARTQGLDFLGVGWGFAHAHALAPHSVRPPLQRVEDLLDVVLTARAASDLNASRG
jgi:phosphoglycolate phosphatase